MAKQVTEIQAATVNRVIEPSTGKCLLYLVKSDRTNDYYQVTATRVNGQGVYHCSCPATVAECKHIRGVLEVLAIRKQEAEERAAEEMAQAVFSHQTNVESWDRQEAAQQYNVLEAAIAVVKDAELDNAYEVIAAMRAAVAEVPSFVERFQNEAAKREAYCQMFNIYE